MMDALALFVLGTVFVYSTHRILRSVSRAIRHARFGSTFRDLGVRIDAAIVGDDLGLTAAGRPALLRPDWIEGIVGPPCVLEVDVRGVSPGTLKICSEAWETTLARVYGVRDFKTGNPGFDDSYLVHAAPASMAEAVFSVERGSRMIAAVRRLGRLGLPIVDLGRERLRVGVEGALREPEMIADLAGAAREIAECILEVRLPEGIRWLGEAHEKGTCQVCGTEMRERRVRCASCDTPHHEECWRYTGECSTFACRERRYVS
jgi:RING finger family protein